MTNSEVAGFLFPYSDNTKMTTLSSSRACLVSAQLSVTWHAPLHFGNSHSQNLGGLPLPPQYSPSSHNQLGSPSFLMGRWINSTPFLSSRPFPPRPGPRCCRNGLGPGMAAQSAALRLATPTTMADAGRGRKRGGRGKGRLRINTGTGRAGPEKGVYGLRYEKEGPGIVGW